MVDCTWRGRLQGFHGGGGSGVGSAVGGPDSLWVSPEVGAQGGRGRVSNEWEVCGEGERPLPMLRGPGGG